MEDHHILAAICVVFVGALVAATVALSARQAMIVGYLVIGAVCGPNGMGLIDDPKLIEELSHVGIIFLLYLLGLSLQPKQLLTMLGEAFAVTLWSSVLVLVAVMGSLLAFGYGTGEAFIVGAAMMFSSTIIGLKLLPTTTLHHKHAGQVVVSVLLLQDMIAIALLVGLETYAASQTAAIGALASKFVALPLLLGACVLLERYVLEPLIARFDRIQEYVFLLVIAWCLGVATTASAIGLSPETGAFIAGVALASSPVSPFISETLRPLRDFFLIMFFFALGADFDLAATPTVLAPAVLTAALVLGLKPLVFRFLLRRAGEPDKLSLEVGVRLGQASEFALLIGFLALNLELISSRASDLIQLATLVTFVVSSYVVVLRFPTPIGVSDRLRQD